MSFEKARSGIKMLFGFSLKEDHMNTWYDLCIDYVGCSDTYFVGTELWSVLACNSRKTKF